MRILLVNFNNHESYSGMYSLAALASYIDTILGIEVKVVDAIRQPFYHILTTWRPDIVAMTSYTVQYGKTVEQAHKIKALLPSCKLVIGGHHITSMPESLVPPIDCAILGEGEVALGALCKGEQNIKGLITSAVPAQNNCCKASLELCDPVDVSTLPVVNLPKYTEISNYSRGIVGLVASRGCFYNCKYCNIRAMTKQVRLYPVDKVVKEIQLYYDVLKCRIMIFWDDVFGLDKDWTQALIAGLRNKNLLGKIQFHIHVRANTATEERCQLWKELGVVAWNMGLDFGDDVILKAKKATIVQLIKTRRLC
jgi:radical SAM superfamily enzyme YgiQ (UPF0313 family)